MMKVLNVGGGPGRDLPSIYGKYEQALLDIDPAVSPDVLCDAREMRKLKPSQYDAAFCSHVLEHFHKHEVPNVLSGVRHVLKPSGFAHVIVPNMTALFCDLVKGNRDIDETWYMAGPNAITFHDVIYGWGREVSTGNAYYCHKTGFTEKSLAKALRAAGFVNVSTATDRVGNLFAFAFKSKPTPQQKRELGL